ncbi:MAG TPA: RsmE family RNA methyltransferase [Verrucomicrobiae bacterium]|nr:RsmE family RNA methyltransferase [Verrucomicrobiae bacterium]
MHRFYLPPDQARGKNLILTGREAHHALHVLRIRTGERIVVLDGAGRELMCTAGAPQRDDLPLTVTQENSVPPLPYQVTLLQAIPKGKIIESIIQKAVELGVHRIVPLLSDRVVTQLDHEAATARAEDWRGVAIEAIKQCGSAWLPTIDIPTTPRNFLAHNEKFELPLVGSLQDDRRHPREYFQTFQKERGRLPKSICVWIGPEGDFTPAELNAIKSSGALPITLGRLVLRSETAAIYSLSILNYELQA